MCYIQTPKVPTIDELSAPILGVQDALRKFEEQDRIRKAAPAGPMPPKHVQKAQAIDETVNLMILALTSPGDPFSRRVVDLCKAHLHALAGAYEPSK